MLKNIIKFFLENRLVTALLLILFISWGIVTAPFSWEAAYLPSDPVPVDAIPDLGENQQIVFTEWKGRSPQDVEDQITYPLTTALLSVPGVKTVRSNSMFGFSSIYVIFEEGVDFYWSRSRILEKLSSLPAGILPEGIQPGLGPDATALGQVYWYTLEGRDKQGNVTGGWDLEELRSIQDFYVRYGLLGTSGVAEVASVGGYVKEYQIDVDPNALKSYNVGLNEVVKAVRSANIDIGAKTIEVNKVEYFVRGLGYVKSLADLENTVVKVNQNIPIRIGDVARVTMGPATRRGALDKMGAEVVGGVVVARYGANPLQVINNVKDNIKEMASGMPEKILEDGTVSKLTIVPFYDRTNLIHETLGTLEEALTLEVLVTIIVVIILVMNLRASVVISSAIPIAVLMTFIAMRYFGVDANIVALSGIAIAIGTMADIGIILTENILLHMEHRRQDQTLLSVVFNATSEIASAIITAVSTTIISFIPVFAMEAAEGKLFRPLAFTKTFALLSTMVLAITVLPTLAYWLFSIKVKRGNVLLVLNGLLLLSGLVFLFINFHAGMLLILAGIAGLLSYADPYVPVTRKHLLPIAKNVLYAIVVAYLLTVFWLPLGAGKSLFTNFVFVILLVGGLLGLMLLVIKYYSRILCWCLENRLLFLSIPLAVVIAGFVIMRRTGNEFMPSLDEGSFLLMPSSMPHAGMEENIETLKKLDIVVGAIPEVELAVGKLGRVESPLDPAPISMYENIVNYKSEYKTDAEGNRIRFKTDKKGEFVRDEKGELIPDPNGEYFRQWRDHIHSIDDIWEEISKAANLPGITNAPKLQPIETRLIMLQTGMRAPMGVKIKGPDLRTIEAFGYEIEKYLKQVEGIKESSVFADRIVGKPYLEIDIDRVKIGRYGLSIEEVQHYLEVALGGITLSRTVEGRERFPIRVRYPRELRGDPERIKDILIPTPAGPQVPLGQLAELKYVQGPQAIKSEDGFLVGYVIFDKEEDFSEVEVVEDAAAFLKAKVATGELNVPKAVSYRFSGNYENQVRAAKRLSIIIPLALITIFLILYFQFRSVPITLMVFTGIFVAFAGGFIMIWLYGEGWFMNFELFDTNLRNLFGMHPINLSVAVWVGFIALFGIATDDGVLMATYLNQVMEKKTVTSRKELNEVALEGGNKRVRPAMMTTATTILALLPVLTSTGRGSDIMIPMAIPSVGGMAIQTMTMFIVPVLYVIYHEWKLKLKK